MLHWRIYYRRFSCSTAAIARWTEVTRLVDDMKNNKDKKDRVRRTLNGNMDTGFCAKLGI
jgi:hypothetical protein